MCSLSKNLSNKKGINKSIGSRNYVQKSLVPILLQSTTFPTKYDIF